MMHVFSLGVGGESYEAIQTLSDHSAAVTSVRFVRGSDGTLHLLSSGADKSLIFHSMEKVSDTQRKNGTGKIMCYVPHNNCKTKERYSLKQPPYMY